MKKIITFFAVTASFLMVAQNHEQIKGDVKKIPQKSLIIRAADLMQGLGHGASGAASLYLAYLFSKRCYEIVAYLSKPIKFGDIPATEEQKSELYKSGAQQFGIAFAVVCACGGFHYKINPLKQSWNAFKEAFN